MMTKILEAFGWILVMGALTGIILGFITMSVSSWIALLLLFIIAGYLSATNLPRTNKSE
jgi:hypothetical protein